MVSVQAAVTRGGEVPFVFEELDLEGPRADELLVKVSSSGVCHNDIATAEGNPPMSWPAVLGHEGAGVVERVGSAVTGFAPGDRVVLSLSWCGHCKNCLRGWVAYCEFSFPLNFSGTREDGSTTLTAADGTAVGGSFFGQSSFSTHTVVEARFAVKVPADLDLDLDLLGPLGCGFQTGSGAIFNALKVEPGSSVIVSGTGAVGLAAVMAAKAVGATTIVAVDVLQARLDTALEFGATHAVNGREDDVVAQIGEILGGGADYAFDTTGVPAALTNSLLSLRFGGELGTVALGPEGAAIPIFAMFGKTIHNISRGSAVPRIDVPRLLALHQRGLFPFDRLITKYPFSQIEQAIADTKSGAAVKAVLTMP